MPRYVVALPVGSAEKNGAMTRSFLNAHYTLLQTLSHINCAKTRMRNLWSFAGYEKKLKYEIIFQTAHCLLIYLLTENKYEFFFYYTFKPNTLYLRHVK